MTSDEIRTAIESMSADELEAYGLVRGPVDADGVMWHSGDMSDTSWGVIEGIAYRNGTWFVCGHDISAPWMEADSVRHYHKPTVSELLDELEGLRGTGDYEAVVTRAAELAEQLRELIDNDR